MLQLTLNAILIVVAYGRHMSPYSLKFTFFMLLPIQNNILFYAKSYVNAYEDIELK